MLALIHRNDAVVTRAPAEIRLEKNDLETPMGATKRCTHLFPETQ
ncbi:hypothetical protein RSSM_02147 [Rhodopirellula sallentina SM41]|uniref:Uncharacterized protein n=1 Tax=Rhodopirellula sallentina SM41 TaxID=1263870 RepID=M5UK60_9BACT|nr:hypothetical protein RSSM_02147 [Rhodopirellula sallentina SM41]